MSVLPLRIRAIGADIKAVADDVASTYCESRHAEASESAPPGLKEALDRFLTIAYHLDVNQRAIDGLSRDELTKLGDHGLALLATRSQDPERMESAFQALIRNLPEEAPRFFSEGMEQMDALDYPPQVRKLMERYYQEWSTQTLH